MTAYLYSAVVSNKKIAPGIYDMTVTAGDAFAAAEAGQFAQLFVEKGENILPRPVSLCDFDQKGGLIRFVYQVVGQGTDYFSKLAPGDDLKIMGPLGSGFPVEREKKTIAVVGGGVGVPPLLALVKKIKKDDPAAEITVFLGFRTDPFLVKDFAGLGVNLHIATDNGGFGFHGNVVQLMKNLDYTAETVYACGPKPMLKALSAWSEEKNAACFVSMEERMACGLGACVGCAIPIKNENGFTYKKVCKDGPVFESTEVMWDAL